MPCCGKGRDRNSRAGSSAGDRVFGTPRNGLRPPATGALLLPFGNTVPPSTGELRGGCFPGNVPPGPAQDSSRPYPSRGGKGKASDPEVPPTGTAGGTPPPPRRTPRSTRDLTGPSCRAGGGQGGQRCRNPE